MRRLFPLTCLWLLGCASLEVMDSPSPDPKSAYVVVHPTYTIGTRTPSPIDLTLACIEADRRKVRHYLRRLENDEVTVVRVNPGICYVEQIQAPFYNAGWATSHKALATIFEARAGVLSYPGQWRLHVAVLSASTTGSPMNFRMSQEYQLYEEVRFSEDIAGLLQKGYPQLAARLSLVATRLDPARVQQVLQ